MTTCIVAFLIALFVSIALTRSIIRVAVHLDFVDKPDYVRKFHQNAVPHVGGIGIFIAFFVPVAALFFFYENFISEQLLHVPTELLGLTTGATIGLAMGFVDDVRGLRKHWKLLLQALAATVAFATGYAISEINIPFVGVIEVGIISYPLTLFWFLGCMNALNFLDGLDGLAAGVSLLVSITLFLVSLIFENRVGMVLSISLAGAILGFLLYNFHPARIFLGDSGSMLLGFLIGALSILAGRTTETTTAISLFIPLIALGLPILDTCLVIARRWFNRAPVAEADRRHIHYSLISMGLGHKRTVLILYLATVVFGICALLITFERGEVTILVLGAMCIIGFVCVRVFAGVNMAGLFSRGFDAGARSALERALLEMQNEGTAERVWGCCHPVMAAVGIDQAELRLFDEISTQVTVLPWTRGDAEPKDSVPDSGDQWSANLKIYSQAFDIRGELDVVKTSRLGDRVSLAAEVLDTLRLALGANLERLKTTPES